LHGERIQVAQGAPAEPEAEYRNAFLRAAAYLRISRQEARALVALLSGKPFEQCGWAELEPAIRELESIIDKVTNSERCRRNEYE
jgi:acyl-CoA reductase-like NAD-dependent aldehyde dehydrogenase